MTEEKKLIVQDKIGQAVKVGSIVAAPDGKTSMMICRVTKITDKMLEVELVDPANLRYRPVWRKHQNQVVCLDELEHTVMYMMVRNL